MDGGGAANDKENQMVIGSGTTAYALTRRRMGDATIRRMRVTRGSSGHRISCSGHSGDVVSSYSGGERNQSLDGVTKVW